MEFYYILPMQTMKNDLCTSTGEQKKSFTHFSKRFPYNILHLHINAHCPHLSHNIQPPLLQEVPVLLFSLNKCWLYIQRYESRNCSNSNMTFRAWNKEMNRPHLTSEGLGSSFLNGFHMKQRSKKSTSRAHWHFYVKYLKYVTSTEYFYEMFW